MAFSKIHSWKIHAALVLANILLGSMGPVLKMVFRDLPPWTVAPFRVAGVAVCALAYGRWQGMAFPPRSVWPSLLGLGVLGISINQLFFLIGISKTSAIVGMLLITTVPVFTYVIAVGWGQEVWRVRRMLGVAVACGGALLAMVGRPVGVEGSAWLWGGFFIILNCLSYSWYLVLSRPYVKEYSTFSVMMPVFVGGAVMTVLVTAPFIDAGAMTRASLLAWIGVAYVIVGPTFLGYLLNAWALAKGASASTVAIYICLQPLVASLIAMPFLGERPTWMLGGSAALLVWGIVLVTASDQKEKAREVIASPVLD